MLGMWNFSRLERFQSLTSIDGEWSCESRETWWETHFRSTSSGYFIGHLDLTLRVRNSFGAFSAAHTREEMSSGSRSGLIDSYPLTTDRTNCLKCTGRFKKAT